MKYNTWFVFVLVNGEWRYIADNARSNLEFTQYMSLAKSYTSLWTARKVRLGYIARGMRSKVVKSDFSL